jgi:AcrR family transcriptional regulator
MEAIAAEAGVALPTLYAAFGSKGGVVSRLVGRLVSGTPDGQPILQTSRAKEVLAEPDARRSLVLFAAHMNQVLERMGPIHEAMKSAARTEAEVSEVFNRSQERRFANLLAVAERLAQRGALRKSLSVSDAGRTIWVLASAEVRQLLLGHAGWSAEQYEAWLADTLAAALLK